MKMHFPDIRPLHLKKNIFFSLIFLCLFSISRVSAQGGDLFFLGEKSNDLYKVLEKERISVKHFTSLKTAVEEASNNTALIIVADGYPGKLTPVSQRLLNKASRKGVKIYLEYPENLEGIQMSQEPIHTRLERGIVTSDEFGASLKELSILGINDGYVLPMQAESPLLVIGKVAGLDKAEYGIADVETYPLLFRDENLLISSTKLTNFATGRYGPNDAWKQVWTTILQWLTDTDELQIVHWPSHVKPMYGKDEVLPENARLSSIKNGVDWFSNGKFYIHPSWKDYWLEQQGDGTNPMGPPLDASKPNGDGSLGILEGHASNVYHDGTQQYRYWLRADVQGESAFALAAAGNLLGDESFSQRAENLLNFTFSDSNLRAENRDNPDRSSFGLIGWSVTHPGVYYGDDNARFLLGILGASAYMATGQWDREIMEGILSNFRTTGIEGFRGERIEEKDLEELGWQHYWNRDIINPAPHFESWMWALYLWLYDKTGYEPLLERTKIGIGNMMERYPDDWKWTNGIQQERARMVLPLAWLVRVADTPQHREWLDTMVSALLENQVASGAIREELGGGKGRYGRTASNAEYGLHEAPLIFNNGDPIADMLYTNNFAFFSLNEAAHATQDPEYKKAVDKLSDFLTRIQVSSQKHKDLDGAWFRAFEYDRWEYWASNADAGWGAWGTLSGWTQSWIVATQVLCVQDQNFWELTEDSMVSDYMDESLEVMFKDLEELK